MPNKLPYTWRGGYCKYVWPAQFPVLIEVLAPSLLEQHPWYVAHRDRAGYNTTEITYYTAFQFTATIDTAPQIAVNKL